MIEFVAGVAFGYFCRPIVTAILTILKNAWNSFQNKDKPNV